MFTTKLCPQLITLAILLLVNIITVALFAGPSVLKLIFKQGPIGHTLVFAFKLLFVFALCKLNLNRLAWFTATMFALVAFFSYGLAAFVTYNIDKLRPLVNESVKCAKQAKNHEERVACRAVALHKLRQAFTPPNMKQSKK